MSHRAQADALSGRQQEVDRGEVVPVAAPIRAGFWKRVDPLARPTVIVQVEGVVTRGAGAADEIPHRRVGIQRDIGQARVAGGGAILAAVHARERTFRLQYRIAIENTGEYGDVSAVFAEIPT